MLNFNEAINLKIEEIASCIISKINKPYNDLDPGLFTGEFGIILFLLFYRKYSKKKIESVDIFIEKVVTGFLGKTKSNNFGNGFSGILYLFKYLKEQDLIDIDTSEVEEPLNQLLCQNMINYTIQNNYDFVMGSLGNALYFQKKYGDSYYSDIYLKTILDTAEKDYLHNTFKWNSLIYPVKKIGYNLSLSHGMSALLLFFVKVLKNDSNNSLAKELLIGLGNYLLSQEVDFNIYGCHFPSHIIDGRTSRSRLAWCYGDLGVAISLLEAGKTIGNDNWIEKSLNVLYNCAQRKDMEKEGVIDSGICHGSVGLAIIYRRLFMNTGSKLFKDVTDYWIDKTMSLSYFDDGLCGYKTYAATIWKCDYSLLTGISGVGLGLMSYIKNDPQSWDELFLLS